MNHAPSKWHGGDSQALQRDRRVGLLIVESDAGQRDPQTLARVSTRRDATEVLPTDSDYDAVKAAYPEMFPQAAVTFGLGDFGLYRITPREGRKDIRLVEEPREEPNNRVVIHRSRRMSAGAVQTTTATKGRRSAVSKEELKRKP